eukprot:jgi/Astpho2/7868/Aster-06151
MQVAGRSRATPCIRCHTLRTRSWRQAPTAPFNQRQGPALSRHQRSSLHSRTACAAAANTLYDFSVPNIDGKPVDLSKYRGKVLLICNVASQCGFSGQYIELAELYNRFKDRGFVVLGVPCNQFGGQEPGSSASIKAFAKGKGFPTDLLTAKSDVNGPNELPLYSYLKKAKGGLLTSDIKWNFTKFLVARDGRVVSRSGSPVSPAKLAQDIEKLL